MKSTATPNPLATVITGSLADPIIADVRHYGTFAASYSFVGANAKNIAAFGSCPVELAVDGLTIIRTKWYNAEFVRAFAVKALVSAAASMGSMDAVCTPEESGVRIKCRCTIIVNADINSSLIDLSRAVASFYRDHFQEEVDAAKQEGKPVEFDAPGRGQPEELASEPGSDFVSQQPGCAHLPTPDLGEE